MAEPIRELGRQAAHKSGSSFVLAIHDWSKIACGSHRSKKDLGQLTHEYDVGYELYSCLLADGQNGLPLAPMEFRLETGTEIHHTQSSDLVEEQWHTDQVANVMKSAQSWGINKPIIHVIDQEADSVAHYRHWDAAGELFLVRSEDRYDWLTTARGF